MGHYIVKRVGQMAVILLLISIFVFLLMSFIPGDPVYAMMGEEVSQEEYDRVYHELELDKPVMVRYVSWLTKAFRGNLGQSTQFHKPTVDVLSERVPVTLYLSFIAFIISVPLGILFGVISAVFRGKAADNVVTLLANITACLPQFWIGVLVMYVFSLKLGWLPSYGFTFPWDDFSASMRQTAMPLFCLALGGIATTTRQTRSSMLEVIRQDYVRTARSDGKEGDLRSRSEKRTDSGHHHSRHEIGRYAGRLHVCGIRILYSGHGLSVRKGHYVQGYAGGSGLCADYRCGCLCGESINRHFIRGGRSADPGGIDW